MKQDDSRNLHKGILINNRLSVMYVQRASLIPHAYVPESISTPEHLDRADINPAPFLLLQNASQELPRPVDMIQPPEWQWIPELIRAVFA